jgi:hypothetical protein
VLEACDETSRALKPREEAFDMPAAFVASKWATILGLRCVSGMVRRDHLDTERRELGIELVAVVGTVTDESSR